MKRYTILATLLLLATACVREGQFSSTPTGPEAEPRVSVILTLEEPVVLQAGTKATPGTEMGVDPKITDIRVAVFGSSGYLKDYVSAVPVSGYADVNYDNTNATTQANTTYQFKVRLPVNLEPSQRTLHIIANGPSELAFNAYEDDIMKELTVRDGTGAYWQRIVLPQGILAVEDEQAEEGYSLVDQNLIPTVRLLRNFASVVVSETADNFILEEYMLCNMPRSGAVAAYSDNHGDWVSVPQMMSEAGASSMVDGFITFGGKRYEGFPLEPELDTYVPSSAADFLNAGNRVSTHGGRVTVKVNGVDTQVDGTVGDPIYIYERAVSHNTPPFVLLKGRFVDPKTDPADLEAALNAANDTYYRLDIAIDYLEYFPFYRNYQYSVNISEVETPGYLTPGEAAQHNSGDNFSMSLDTELLSDVANDNLHLFVSSPFIDKTYTAGASNEYTFWYKLLYLENGTWTKYNDEPDLQIALVQPSTALATGITGASSSSALWKVAASDTDEDGDGLSQERLVTFKLKDPADEGVNKLSSTLRLVGEKRNGDNVYRLVRDVTIRVYNPETEAIRLVPDCVANLDEGGQTTRLEIPLPLDLEHSMFPLELKVSDSNKALNPASNEDMPVQVSGGSYYFLYTLNWSDYQRLCDEAEYTGADHALLTCDLTTIKKITSYDDTGGVRDYQTTVSVSCDYFSGEAVLHADEDDYIAPSRRTISPSDNPAHTTTVKVKSGSAWSLTLTHEDGSAVVGASLSTSTSDAATTTPLEVTVTLPDYGTDNVQYRLTLVNADQKTREAYILQKPNLLQLTLKEEYAGENGLTVPCGTAGTTEMFSQIVTVKSSVEYYLVVSTDANDWSDPDKITVSPDRDPEESVQLKIPGNASTDSRYLYIRAYSVDDENGYPGLHPDWVKVKQDGASADLSAPISIRMYAKEAEEVKVSSTIPTKLRVYDSNGNEMTTVKVKKLQNGKYVQMTSGGSDVVTPVDLEANPSGEKYSLVLASDSPVNAPRTFTVKLFTKDGSHLLDSKDIHQQAEFRLSLAPGFADGPVDCNVTQVGLNFHSEIGAAFSVAGMNDTTQGAITLPNDPTAPDYPVNPSSVTATETTVGGVTTAFEVHPLTLTIPQNNTIDDRTYVVTATSTVTANNAAYNSPAGLTTSVEVKQSKGSAELTVTEPDIDSGHAGIDIRMNDTQVNVKVKSTFATKVRVYIGNSSTPWAVSGIVQEVSFTADNTDGIEQVVTVPVNDSPVDRTLTFRLCNADGVEFPTLDKTVTQKGSPAFSLVAAKNSIENTEPSVDLSFTTEVLCDFSVTCANGSGSPASVTLDTEGDDGVFITRTNSATPITQEGSASDYVTYPLTLHVPVNNLLVPKTYTVTATTTTYTNSQNQHPSVSATVTQAAGTAAFTVTEPDLDPSDADVDIRMNDTGVNVTVASSFATLVKVYEGNPVASGATPLTTSNVINANTSGEAVTVTVPANTSGSDRVLTLRLCNADGVEFPSLDKIVVQGPVITLVSDEDDDDISIHGYETKANLVVTSDENWKMGVVVNGTFLAPGDAGFPSGVSFLPATGNSGAGSTSVTVTLPVNYNTTAASYTFAAKSTESGSSLMSNSVIVTQSRVTGTGSTSNLTFNTNTSGDITPNNLTSEKGVVNTASKIKAELDGTASNSTNSYIQFTTDATLTLTPNAGVQKITQVVFHYDALALVLAAYYDPSSIRFNNAAGDTSTGQPSHSYAGISATSSYTWSGNDTSDWMKFTMAHQTGLGANDIRITSIVISYTYYIWE